MLLMTVMMMMMMMMMELLMLVVVSCYVQLHGYGYHISGQQSEWYRAVALNGVDVMNVTFPLMHAQGIYTYIVDPTSCSASDYHYFDTYDDPAASHNLINYLQNLANG